MIGFGLILGRILLTLRRIASFPQIVSEERSGGSTNVKTAYPGYRGGGDVLRGTPKGKYDWHTVVDGLSE